MATQYPGFTDDHIRFISAQPLFFVATAAPEGRINLSPKGCDSLRVDGPNRLLWLNMTGSGNETAGHLLQSTRMTVMWCSFGARPTIMRAYGTARAVHHNDADWDAIVGQFAESASNRQVFDMAVDMVQTSCGFGVPKMTEVGPRGIMENLAEQRGLDGTHEFWREHNLTTIDGLPTGLEQGNLTK